MPKKPEATKKNPNLEDRLPPRKQKIKAVARMKATAQNQVVHQFHSSELDTITFKSDKRSKTFHVFLEDDIYPAGLKIKDKCGKNIQFNTLLKTGYYDSNNYITDDELLAENKREVVRELKEATQNYKHSVDLRGEVELILKGNKIIKEPLSISSSSDSSGPFGRSPVLKQLAATQIVPENEEQKVRATLDTAPRELPHAHISVRASDHIVLEDEVSEDLEKHETEDTSNPPDRLPKFQKTSNDPADRTNPTKPERTKKADRKKRQRLNRVYAAYEARKAEGRPAGDESKVDWRKLRQEMGKDGIKEKKRAYQKQIAEDIERYRRNQRNLFN